MDGINGYISLVIAVGALVIGLIELGTGKFVGMTKEIAGLPVDRLKPIIKLSGILYLVAGVAVAVVGVLEMKGTLTRMVAIICVVVIAGVREAIVRAQLKKLKDEIKK